MKPEWCPQPDGWRYRYEGGKWTVQKNKPAWYRDHMVDVELEPLFSQGALLEAHQRGRREGMEEVEEIVRQQVPTIPVDGPTDPIQEAEYFALGHVLIAIRAKTQEVKP